MNNFDLGYRPLVSGISILNARVSEPGTIGYIAKDAGGAPWIISCYHVLCDSDLGAYVADEPIFQPAAQAPGNVVARTSQTRASVGLDCAAASLVPGIDFLNRQLGIGDVGSPLEPVVGMRVLKSGAASGVTEGVISAIRGDDIEIRTIAGYPNYYVLSEPGDSGSLWVEDGSRAAIALHTGRKNPRCASAVRLDAVLSTLGLRAN